MRGVGREDVRPFQGPDGFVVEALELLVKVLFEEPFGGWVKVRGEQAMTFEEMVSVKERVSEKAWRDASVAS